MRDIELIKAPSAPADPLVDDAAYARAPAAGIFSTTTAVDPARSDPNAYFKVSLGGEFGPARAPLLSQPADGGVANLAAATTIIVTPPVVPTPPHTWPGRAANNTSFLNLYPWKKTPPQGLDQNNPNPPPALLAADAATPTLDYSLNGVDVEETPKQKQKGKKHD